MKDKILKLEKCFFKKEYMSNIAWMQEVIDDKFIECGKSGKFFNKEQTINDLSKLESDRLIDIYNYDCQKVGDNIYLVHYVTKTDDGQNVFRTSLWVDKDGLKLYFHQASLLTQDISLVKF